MNFINLIKSTSQQKIPAASKSYLPQIPCLRTNWFFDMVGLTWMVTWLHSREEPTFCAISSHNCHNNKGAMHLNRGRNILDLCPALDFTDA